MMEIVTIGLSEFTSDPAEIAAMSRLDVLRELHKSSEAKRSLPTLSLMNLKESFRIARLSRRARSLRVADFAINHAVGAASSIPLAVKRGV